MRLTLSRSIGILLLLGGLALIAVPTGWRFDLVAPGAVIVFAGVIFLSRQERRRLRLRPAYVTAGGALKRRPRIP
jgi:hypothetical protein